MKTQLNNAKWILAAVASVGLAFATARPTMAHGGGGGGGGSHMSGGSAGKSMSSMSRGPTSFKSSNLSAKSFKSNQFNATNLNSNKFNTLKLNNTGRTNTNVLGNTNSLKNIKLPTTINNKLPTTNLNTLAGGTKGISGKPIITNNSLHNANLGKANNLFNNKNTFSGNNSSNHLGKNCFPNNHCFYPWFVFWPYGGYGGYGGYNIYNRPTYVYGGYPAVNSTPIPYAPTVASTVSGIDLQLVDVRLLDKGDASQQIGPRYRVTFRNAGSTPVDHEFNVAVVAAVDANLTANLPTSESRITSVPTGETTSVDLRLPASAFAMGKDSHSEFAKLFVVVDSRSEVNDVNRDNNGSGLDRTAVQPAT
jgi:hypothetical protein